MTGGIKIRNYQRQKNNPYKLPHNLYMRMLYLVRDYERIKSQRADILHSSPAHDGQPHTGLGNPTENKGIKLAMLDNECSAVEKAIESIPEEYRKGVLRNIKDNERYPITASETTFRRYRYKLTYTLAKILGKI